jgi:vacuolar-type H+-ATPase subunit I/STV1
MSKDESMDIQREVADNISDIKIESIALKSDMNNKLNTISQNLQENQKTMESLMTAITTLNTTLNTTMKEEGKKNRIANAIGRARYLDYLDFAGWFYDESSIDVTSALIKNILHAFLNDKGWYIDTYYPHTERFRTEESKKVFRARLKEEITYLTGTIPIIKLSNDRLAIYHG